jgi:hypothetical protein
MTAAPRAKPDPKSRRALLAGAVGGIGAWAAATMGRRAPTAGAEGDPIRIGQTNYAGATQTELRSRYDGSAFRVVQRTERATAIRADATGDGKAIVAEAGRGGIGVYAKSPNRNAVEAHCPSGVGVAAYGRTALRATGKVTGLIATGQDGYGAIIQGLQVNQFHDIQRVSGAGQPPFENYVRLFARLNDATGKTEVCLRFFSGGTVVIATEP